MAGEIYVSNLGSFDYQNILNMYYQANSLPIQLLQSQETEIDEKVLLQQIQKIHQLFRPPNTL